MQRLLRSIRQRIWLLSVHAAELDDNGVQQLEWRARLVRAVIERKHGDETLVTMLFAGFDQAQSDGLRDAAWLCQRVAEACPESARVATVLAENILRLDKMNRADANAS
jgi:hypothetical protein